MPFDPQEPGCWDDVGVVAQSLHVLWPVSVSLVCFRTMLTRDELLRTRCPAPREVVDRVDLPRCKAMRRVARDSCCPASLWLHVAAPLLAASNMTYVNVGANKGFNVNAFLQLFQRDWNATSADWHSALLSQQHADDKRRKTTSVSFHRDRTSVPPLCGMCAACLERPPPRLGGAQVKVLAIEMMHSTAAVLQHSFIKFGVPGVVVHSAASDREGRASHFAASMGEEALGLGLRPTFSQRRASLTTVRRSTVDELVREAGIVSSIDLLSIDTEGHDSKVLRGAEETLNRTKIVEFEYHYVGVWAQSGSLLRTLSRLEALGFSCYWQGGDGALAPLSATDQKCVVPMKERWWSNVLCTRDGQVRRVFDALIPADYLAGANK